MPSLLARIGFAIVKWKSRHGLRDEIDGAAHAPAARRDLRLSRIEHYERETRVAGAHGPLFLAGTPHGCQRDALRPGSHRQRARKATRHTFAQSRVHASGQT